MVLPKIGSLVLPYSWQSLSRQIHMKPNLFNLRPFTSLANKSCKYDVVIVGGGIVGVATAREIKNRYPKMTIAIVEKENELAMHQSSHNSGVVHAGIYYKPGSMKAKLCGEGLRLCYQYCDENKVPYKKIGKIIVATTPEEVVILKTLEERSIENKVPDLQVLEGKQIQEVEPYCRGLKALWSPQTGIVDFQCLTQHFAKDFTDAGGDIHLKFEVNEFTEGNNSEYPVLLRAKNGTYIQSKYVFTCAGLYSDKIAVMTNSSREPQIIPFRGEYLTLVPNKAHMVKGNIYPVPDPRFPFLGVHFTPKMDGRVLLGPNAVLAFKREGYTWTDFDRKEFIETITYPGFQKMAFKFLAPGSKQMLQSLIRPWQMKDLQKYIPEITTKDVVKNFSGVRAQAMNMSGDLVEDFVFSRGTGNVGTRVLHCRNAPSPAGTSSLAIAKLLADKVKDEFRLQVN